MLKLYSVPRRSRPANTFGYERNGSQCLQHGVSFSCTNNASTDVSDLSETTSRQFADQSFGGCKMNNAGEQEMFRPYLGCMV